MAHWETRRSVFGDRCRATVQGFQKESLPGFNYEWGKIEKKKAGRPLVNTNFMGAIVGRQSKRMKNKCLYPKEIPIQSPSSDLSVIYRMNQDDS